MLKMQKPQLGKNELSIAKGDLNIESLGNMKGKKLQKLDMDD
jgi:hypothetical protein